MARKSNFPNAQEIVVAQGEMATLVSDFDELRSQKYPKSDEEVEQRIQWFFDWCVRHDRRPGVELLALALGTTRQNLWVWQQRDDRKGRAITQAKQLIMALLEQWGQTGKINPVSMIFLMKNHGGYKDSVEITPPQREPSTLLTQEEIARRIPVYDKDIIDDDAQ